MQADTEVGLCILAFSTSSKAVFRLLPGADISSIRPIVNARSALICSPPRMILLAHPSPTNLGNCCVPPPHGRRPTFGSGKASLDCSSAILTSQARAHSSPPPMANPLMAATEKPLKLLNAPKALEKASVIFSAASFPPS